MKSQSMRQVEQLLGNVLRIGLLLSVFAGLIGSILFLWQDGAVVYDFSVFKGEPFFLHDFHEIVNGTIQGKNLALMQLGVWLLIATPVARIFFCLIIFFWQRDFMYVAISGFVFMVLLYSLFWKAF